MEKVGKARIYVGEDSEGALFDDVEIHSSGVVRASDRDTRDVPGVGTMLGETKVAYYSPGQWKKIEPQTVREITLWVSDTPYGADPNWIRLAAYVAIDEANSVAIQHLRDNYDGVIDNAQAAVGQAVKENGFQYTAKTTAGTYEAYVLRLKVTKLSDRYDRNE